MGQSCLGTLGLGSTDYEAAVHFAAQVETAEPVEIQLKDWDAHTFVARLIAVSTHIVALWEAFLLLAGTGWGGGLMLILLAGAKLYHFRFRFAETCRWAVSRFCERPSIGCLFDGWPFQWSNILSSWYTLLGGLAGPPTDREHLSESEWSEISIPVTPIRNRNRDTSPLSSTPGQRPGRTPRTLD